jgi:deazaflavin-dependent oxidoreductase (nitroreductase family)
MSYRTVKRWLYAGNHPNWIAKILNSIYAVIGSIGITSNYLVTLEVTGRKSGKTISLPVVVVIVHNVRYLVSMLGENVQWVQNIRATNGEAVIRSGRREAILLMEVPFEQRAPILKAYLQRAPGARPHFPISKDAPLADFEIIGKDYPTFCIVSRKSSGV